MAALEAQNPRTLGPCVRVRTHGTGGLCGALAVDVWYLGSGHMGQEVWQGLSLWWALTADASSRGFMDLFWKRHLGTQKELFFIRVLS